MFPAIRNATEFFKTRPPMVIFFACLVILMVTTLSFTFYIKHNDQIVNTDVKQNWLSLTRHLTNLNLCLNHTSETGPRFLEETTLTTVVGVDAPDLANGTKVIAYYNLEGWHSFCDPGSPTQNPLFLTVNFTLTGPTKACATIKGPKHLLPPISSQSCDLSESDSNSTLVLYSQGFCSNNTNLSDVKLLFSGDDNFETYLSDSDKTIIYVRLLWCSCVLLFFVLMMLIYAMFAKSDYMYITNKVMN